jgi:drug/metabolite transporter (DMT)-like permease
MKARPGPGLLVATFLLLSLIWGTTWAAIRVGLRGIPPFTGVALRFALASVVLLALAPLFHVRFGGTRRERGLWLVVAALSFCGSYGIVYWCEQWLPSGLAAVLFATFPLFTALLAHVALPAERLTWRSVLGILLGFTGVAVIFSEDLATLLDDTRVEMAAAVFLASPLVSSVANVAVKKWGHGIHPISLSAVPMALTGAAMGLLAVATESSAPMRFDFPSVAATVYLALFGTALTFSLYYWLLSHLPATRIALITYLTPLVAVLVGTVLLDEPLTARILGGAALVVGGVALAVQRS